MANQAPSNMDIQELSIDNVKPYWRNPRDTEGAIDKVKQSIEKYGFNVPITVDKENVIVTGHVRYTAMKQLGRDTIPAVVLDLPEDKIKQFRIADNKTQEFAEWNNEHLINELWEMEELDEMEEFFPAISLDDWVDESMSGGGDPTSEEIEEARNNLEDQFSERTEDYHDDMIDMICPHCGESYEVKRSQVLKEGR